MKMNYKIFLLLLVGYIMVISCSKMDDYLDYTRRKEVLYTGKVDSVLIHSGEERVVFTGLLISDPKISTFKIYWNLRTDSLVVDINRSEGVDTLKVPIPLPEGTYNFEIYTFDDKGNSSIVVNASGNSYGETYRQSIYNRVMKSAIKMGGDAEITWYNGSDNSPFTKLTYINSNDKAKTLLIPNDEENTILPNFKSESKITVQSYFIPDETAIDTFKTEPVQIGVEEDITNSYIQNPGNPFRRADDATDKWGVLEGWQYTPNVINQSNNTKGGWSWDGNPSGVIHLESKDWGGDGITNGKIYQTFELSEGTYVGEFYSDGGGGNSINANFVVAKGMLPPNIEDLENNSNLLARYNWNENSMGGTHQISFTLRKASSVNFGFVTSFGSYTWMHINWVKLKRIADSY